MPYRSRHLLGVDCRPVAIEPPFKGGSGLPNILNPTHSARDKIYHIRGGTCYVASDLVGCVVTVAGKSFIFLQMVLADYTSVGFTSEITMLNGRRILIG